MFLNIFTLTFLDHLLGSLFLRSSTVSFRAVIKLIFIKQLEDTTTEIIRLPKKKKEAK